ncbi:MAG: TolC family protein, partial [Acidiferrobacteraceae bacterium]
MGQLFARVGVLCGSRGAPCCSPRECDRLDHGRRSPRWRLVCWGVLAFVVAGSCSAQTYDPRRWTLAQALSVALQHEGKISLARATISEARANRLKTLSQFAPSLSLSDQLDRYTPMGHAVDINGAIVTAQNAFYGNSTSVNFDWNLFSGDRDVEMYASSRSALRSAMSGLAATINTSVIRVLKAYVALIRDALSVRLQRRILRLDRNIEQLTESRLRHHISSAIDVIRAQQRLIRDTMALEQGQQKKFIDTRTFLKAVGWTRANSPNSVRVVPAVPDPPAVPRQRTDRAWMRSPMVRSAADALASAQSGVSAARSEYWPKVDFVANYGGLGMNAQAPFLSVQGTRAYSYNVGLTLTVPLLPLVNTTASVDKARAVEQKAQVNYQRAITEVTSRHGESWAEWRIAQKILRLATDADRLARRNLQLVQSRYRGRQANRMLLDRAKITAYQAQYGRVSAEATLRL